MCIVRIKSRISHQQQVDISEQKSVTIQEIPLLKDDLEAQNAIEVLRNKGFDVTLKPIPVTKQKQRLASRRAIDQLIKNKTGLLLNKHGINPNGKDLDKKHLGKTNFVLIKSSVHDKTFKKLL